LGLGFKPVAISPQGWLNHKPRLQAAKAAATEGSQVSFVSSNDVLVSGLAKMAEARTYTMAIRLARL
jgi:precorrin-3B methylase